MILWDIASGERLRTFEGHDRGLACIEFKVRPFWCRTKVLTTTRMLCLRTISLYLVPTTVKSKFGAQQLVNAFERWWDTTPLFEHYHSILRLDVL